MRVLLRFRCVVDAGRLELPSGASEAPVLSVERRVEKNGGHGESRTRNYWVQASRDPIITTRPLDDSPGFEPGNEPLQGSVFPS